MLRIKLEPEISSLLQASIAELSGHFDRTVLAPVQRTLSVKPPLLIEVITELSNIHEKLAESPAHGTSLETREIGLLKRAALMRRRHVASTLEKKIRASSDPRLKEMFDEELAVYNELLSAEWLMEPPVADIPHVTDYLTMSHARTSAGEQNNTGLAERIFDEKFGILFAPDLLMSDVAHFRDECSVRRVSFCVSYIDIDKFKNFNKKYVETRVDREVLPIFMRALEAHVYHHGYAYRYGGDEYAVLMPNTSCQEACIFIANFQSRLESTAYYDIEEKITVSAGVVEVDDSSQLTDREIESKAALAKNHAKYEGRDRVAYFVGDRFRDADLRVYENPTLGDV